MQIQGKFIMRHSLFITTLSVFTLTAGLQGNMPLMDSNESSQHLVVNNRILAKVNDKTISVLDVMKKMDVFLTRYYPHLSDSTPARYQYFSSQWKDTLSQMIDNELMLADAEKLELKVTDAEVRETIIERFGPNIMASLDKLQLTYEEARKMVHTDIIVEKMTWYRIHSKALQIVNPQDIKIAYQDYIKKNPPQDKWEYQVLSIRTKNDDLGQAVAQQAYSMLQTTKQSLPEVLEKIKSEIAEDSDLTLAVSEEFKNDGKTISDSHKQVLLNLVINSISQPVRQLSRTDQSVVFRIFHLKNRSKILPPSFNKISDKLKDELLQQAVAKESKIYIEKLREKFGYDGRTMQENIPDDFHPFVIQ